MGAVFLHILVMVFAASGTAREWTDSSGHYKVEAELIGFNDKVVVLKKQNDDLISIPLEQLSTEDQDFLKSKDAAIEDGIQTWTTRHGLKVRGRVLEYAQKDVTVQRRRGRIYVNDRLFDNLPGIYKEMVLQIVSHFENITIEDKKGLESWTLKLKGAPKTFACEGVLLELESGDLYGVPFFFFSEDDRNVLEPGWERWLAAKNDSQSQQQHSFELEAQASAYQRDRETQRQTMQLQLQLQAYDAGLFDLWEVVMRPMSPQNAPMLVVVPARDSRQASSEAQRRYPGYAVGAISKVRRRH
ncbi:MAG: SHD1 domain-containing protein [Planctomycetaceae bacterium]